MNKLLILCVLAAVAAFPQAQTPLTITQSASSATGELRMQERRTNGTNYVGIKAPQSVAANTVWTLPGADGTDNQCLKTDGAGQWSWESCTPERLVSDYNWSQAPADDLSMAGAHTITLAPCPASVDGTASGFYVYLSGGTGTAEVVLATGGTGTGGDASCTIDVTTANTHTGAWTASSASTGLWEALHSVADGAKVAVIAPEGQYNIYATVNAETRPVTIACASLGAIFSAKSDDIKLLDSRSGTGPQVSNCTFRNDDSLTGVTAIYSNSADGPSSGGAFAGRIENNWFVNFDKAIHSVTTNGWHIVGNHIISSPGYNATAAIHTESLTNGDQGTGLIAGNILTCSATCTYGLLWNGPGALQLKHNNFNGYTTQAHLQPAFGTASSSGSTVTWQSGNKFRTNWVGTTIYLGSTARTIASVDSDTQITTSTSIGTISTTDFYINQSSQVSIMSNNFDAGVNTQYGVRWTGAVTFQNAQIDGNFFSNWSAVNNHQAITIGSGTNLNFLGIRNNHIQSAGGTAVYGIRVQSGYGYAVENNQIAGSTTGVSLETTTLYPKVSGNQCVLIGSACLASTDATAEIMESQSVTYAELAALSAASGSRVYCSNCSAVCATAGSGAIASRVNGSWVCSDGTSSRWTLSGSNIYRASQVGIGAAPVSTAALSISGGSGANELYIADASGTTSVQLIAENGYGVAGTYTNHNFYLASDSNARWTVGSNGMFKPFITDTYDIGDLTTPYRVRGIYGKIVDTALAGGTGDYLQTRKLQLFDNTGSSTGASYWDLNVVMSGVGAGQNSYLYLRDNAGTNVFKSERIASGGAVSRTTWYTDLLPDTDGGRSMGTQLLNWDKVYANQLGDSSYPVVVWGANSDFSGLTTTALTINTGAATVGYVWTASTTGGAGSWQAAAGGSTLPVVDTTGIAKGSSDATKILRFEVDGFTTATTRVLTPPNADATIAGLNVTQTFVNPQTIALASLQSQLQLSQTNNTGAYDPACLTLAATNTSTSTVYGAAQLCAGYESASFTNEKFALRTATSSGIYQDVLTAKNQVVTFAGDIVATAGTFSFTGGTMSGTMKPLFNSTGTIGDTSYYYANGYFTTADIGTVEATTAYKMGGTTVLNSSRNVVGVNAFAQSITFSAGSTYNVGSTGAPPLNVYGNYIEPLTELVMGSGVSFRGSLIPATNNTDAIGNTSFRLSNVATVNANISGTITTPSGSAGITSTKTVRDSAGTGTCTLIFSGGILTGGTC